MKPTRSQLVQFLVTFTAIIGTVTALASLSTLNLDIAIAASILIVILGIAIGIHHFRSKDNKTAAGISGLKELKLLTIREVLNETELRKVADLDEECYGEHTVDFQGLKGWWERYPKGIYAIFFNRKLIGATGIWPLTKNAFGRLSSGNLMESQLLKNDISFKAKKDEYMYWYFADIILEKKHRKQKLISYFALDSLPKRKFKDESLGSYFLQQALKKWIEEAILPSTVQLCAIGATPTGIHLLEEFGFEKARNQTPDKLPIYMRISTLQEIQHDIEKAWDPLELT